MSPPSEMKYHELLAMLREATARLHSAETEHSRIECSIAALRSVIMYLSCDNEVRKDGLVRPLSNLENAVHDAAKGAAPALFDHAPAGPGDRPRGLIQEDVQAALAWSLELLTRARMGTDKAGRWVEDEARRRRLTDSNGSTVTAKRIIAWRKDISRGKMSPRVSEVFEACRQEDGRFLADLRLMPAPMALESAKQKASVTIRMIADLAPRSAPKPMRRNARN
jgi:hypothetical protein